MPAEGRMPWESLERWSARMFLWGAAIIAGGALVVLYDIGHGTEVRGVLGQVFVGVSWTAVFLGMLGLYPRLAERRPWLARACAFLAGVGVIGYVVMTVVSVAGVAGTPESTLEAFIPVFLPPVGASSLLAFPLFAVAGLLTGAYSRPVSILLAAPTVIFLANYATGATADSIIVVQMALVLVFGATGYLLWTDSGSAEGTPSSTHTSA